MASYRDRIFVYSLHLIAWVVILVIPLFIVHTYGDGDSQPLNHMYGNMVVYGLMFYVNYLFLTPRFFLKGRRGWYFLTSLILIVVLYWVLYYINNVVLYNPERAREFDELMKKLGDGQKVFRPPFKGFGPFFYGIGSLLISGFALGLGSMEQLIKNERRQKDLEKEKLNSELAFLKTQVSPHFLFNTLNNIYSLISIDSAMAQDSVMKLSKLMRYLLYESEQGNTPLSNEINFMTHYIDLMKLRLSPKVNLVVDFPQSFTDRSVPPLLFIPFIENAFKHGISYRESSFIHISMNVTNEKVVFNCENSKTTNVVLKESSSGGIGLKNVQKRLDLLFPNRYQLTIEDGETIYSVRLVI